MERSAERIADFLNHGAMPWVGEDLPDRVIAFWHLSGGGEGIRAMLVEGEVGSGKSRLVEEIGRRDHPPLSRMIHLRFVEGGASGPVELLGSALGGEGRAIEQLRRLSRLRRTLLILEDLHTLDQEPAAELVRLLDSLADEPLALLLLTRPGAARLTDALGRWSPERLQLRRWGEPEITRLLEELFGSVPEQADVELLHRTTTGLPLAVRAVLRDWIINGAGDDRAARAERSVRGIGRSLAIDLSDEEVRAAGRIASLGEVFAIESALHIAESEMIDRLRFRGVLYRTEISVPGLPGLETDPVDYPTSTETILTFSHRLLFEYLRNEVEPPLPELSRLCAAGAPLYAHDPISTLLERLSAAETGTLIADADLFGTLLQRISNILHDLVLSVSWKDAVEPVATLAGLLEVARPEIDSETARLLDLSLCFKEAILAESRGDARGHRAAIARARDLCYRDDIDEAPLARYRLALLVKDPDAEWNRPEFVRDIFAAGSGMIDRFPHLGSSDDYAMFLCIVAIFAHQHNDRPLLRDVEQRYQSLVESFDTLEDRRRLERWFLPVIIQVYDSMEELERRRREQASIRSLPRVDSLAAHVLDHEIRFLYDTGEAERCLTKGVDGERIFRLRASTTLAEASVRRRLVMMSSLGRTPDELKEVMAEALKLAEDPDRALGTIGGGLIVALWMSGSDAWRVVAEETPGALDGVPPEMRRLLDAEGTTEFEPSTTPILRTDDLITTLMRIAPLEQGDAASEEEVTDALRQICGVILAREHPGWIDRTLEITARFLRKKELRQWERDLEAMRREVGRQEGLGVRLTVIDRFGVQTGRGGVRKITGGRMKEIVTLLVIDQIIDRRSTLDEFARLVSGEEMPDLDGARNNLYVRLHGLRKILGPDAIVTETGQAPRLDLDVVSVDIIEVLDAMKFGVEESERGRILSGVESCRRALDRLGTGVPFPNQYDRLAEAARDQVEVTVRNGVLRSARLALDSGDHRSAATLLGDQVKRTPEDEESGRILIEALEMGGELIEAAFLRKRGEREWYG